MSSRRECLALLKYRLMEVLTLDMRFPLPLILSGVLTIRASYAKAHGRDGAGGPERTIGSGSSINSLSTLMLWESESLQFLACTFGGLGGHAPELVAEVFVLEPEVEGGLTDTSFAGGLGHVGSGSEDGGEREFGDG